MTTPADHPILRPLNRIPPRPGDQATLQDFIDGTPLPPGAPDTDRARLAWFLLNHAPVGEPRAVRKITAQSIAIRSIAPTPLALDDMPAPTESDNIREDIIAVCQLLDRWKHTGLLRNFHYAHQPANRDEKATPFRVGARIHRPQPDDPDSGATLTLEADPLDATPTTGGEATTVAYAEMCVNLWNTATSLLAHLGHRANPETAPEGEGQESA